jgi:hypothetical protein
MAQNVRRHALPGIAHAEPPECAGPRSRLARQIGFIQHGRRRFHHQQAAARHGIARVDGQVQ